MITVRRDFLDEIRSEYVKLRERARRRDAVAEPPPEGEWVLGLSTTGRLATVRLLDGDWCDDVCVWYCGFVGWWPLPEVER